MSVNAVPDPPPDRESKEPAMMVAGYTSLATATASIIGLLIAFKAGITPEQGAAIVAAVMSVAALAPLASGWFTRSRVYAPATVALMMDAAAAEHDPDPAASRHRWPEGDVQ